MDCTTRIAKTKAMISFAVTAKLICVFVFSYAKSRFSHDAALLKQGGHIMSFITIKNSMQYTAALKLTTFLHKIVILLLKI